MHADTASHMSDTATLHNQLQSVSSLACGAECGCDFCWLRTEASLCFVFICVGFMVGKKAEAGGIAKDGAKMVMAVANVKVGPLGA